MRSFSITNIAPSTNPTIPATFTVSFDQRPSFHGREWIDAGGARFPEYTYDNDTGTATPPPPIGTGVLLATTFEVVDNPKYNGRYTVYTKTSAGDFDPSSLDGSLDTVIRVNEAMGAGSGAELTTGRITAISTYVLSVYPGQSILLLEQQNIQNRPVELMGHRTSGWGEVMFQNLVNNAQNYAGLTAPANPFVGQFWFDTGLNILKIREIGGWVIVNAGYFGAPPFYHIQGAPSSTWVITHNFGLSAPFTCSADFFVDIGAGVHKSILPQDVTYLNANQLSVTFSTAYAGRATARA